MSSLDIESDLVAAREALSPDIGSAPAVPFRIDVRAVLGGAAIATAISWVMTSFGAAIGLAATPNGVTSGWNAVALSIATGLWILWIAVSSFAAGGYVAARLRLATYDATEHEQDLRDGAHGLMVWAVALIALTWLASPAFSGLAKTAAGVGAAAVASNVDSQDAHIVDRLTRAGGSGATVNESTLRDDITRSLAVAAASGGAMAAEDRDYLTRQISAREGVPAEEAGKRIDDAVAVVRTAAQKARDATKSARRAGVILAFLTGASMLVGAAAAWWAASMGGKHRDQEEDFSHLTNWR